MQETWVRALGQEGPLEKGIAAHSSSLTWEIPWSEELAGYSPWGHKESDATEWVTDTHRENGYYKNETKQNRKQPLLVVM